MSINLNQGSNFLSNKEIFDSYDNIAFFNNRESLKTINTGANNYSNKYGKTTENFTSLDKATLTKMRADLDTTRRMMASQSVIWTIGFGILVLLVIKENSKR
tara:strand:- start:924 stop:1229 length:306 start_codon:yes stop_codon:yes gene_type:complete